MADYFWRKLGRIFNASGAHPLLASHAANPVAIRSGKDTYRIFYSGRDAANRSSVGYFDFDLTGHRVTYIHDRPAFAYGPTDSFYRGGISIGCVYKAGNRRFMLFMGWQSDANAHWRGDIGRLVVGDDLSLSLEGDAPLLGMAPEDPLSLSYPWVEQTAQGTFIMWYGSTVTWDAGNGEMLHVFNVATSKDGLQWKRHGLAVPFCLGTAQAFSRPTVLSDGSGGYQMWFSYRSGTGQSYRIGRAVSSDGLSWQLRLADAGIDVSALGWDAEMIAYPFVFRHDGETYMLYNGNGYGRSGIGLAKLEAGASRTISGIER